VRAVRDLLVDLRTVDELADAYFEAHPEELNARH
jgi:hypothetical protein